MLLQRIKIRDYNRSRSNGSYFYILSIIVNYIFNNDTNTFMSLSLGTYKNNIKAVYISS